MDISAGRDPRYAIHQAGVGGPIRWGFPVVYTLTCPRCRSTDGWFLLVQRQHGVDGERAWAECSAHRHRVEHPLIYPEMVHVFRAENNEALMAGLQKIGLRPHVVTDLPPGLTDDSAATVSYTPWEDAGLDARWWDEHWPGLREASDGLLFPSPPSEPRVQLVAGLGLDPVVLVFTNEVLAAVRPWNAAAYTEVTREIGQRGIGFGFTLLCAWAELLGLIHPGQDPFAVDRAAGKPWAPAGTLITVAGDGGDQQKIISTVSTAMGMVDDTGTWSLLYRLGDALAGAAALTGSPADLAAAVELHASLAGENQDLVAQGAVVVAMVAAGNLDEAHEALVQEMARHLERLPDLVLLWLRAAAVLLRPGLLLVQVDGDGLPQAILSGPSSRFEEVGVIVRDALTALQEPERAGAADAVIRLRTLDLLELPSVAWQLAVTLGTHLHEGTARRGDAR